MTSKTKDLLRKVMNSSEDLQRLEYSLVKGKVRYFENPNNHLEDYDEDKDEFVAARIFCFWYKRKHNK